jgi:hypothetical protein
MDRLPYREIWAVDFEFVSLEGERPEPVCMVARELRSGRLVRLWRDELRACVRPPYSIGADALFVAYYASAELGCHLALGWPMPARILDLYPEFRAATNGTRPPAGNGLLGALAYHGLDSMAGSEKAEMRELIMGGGPWSGAERAAILDYCQEDVDALARLLPAMLPELLARPSSPHQALGHALLRGRYMAAAARMEWNGVPLDTSTLTRLLEAWEPIRGRLVDAVDPDFGVYEGGTFRTARFADYLARNGIPWPRLDSGALDLKDDTFRQQAKAHPRIAPLHELRHALSRLRLHSLAVGRDGRNRTILGAFGGRYEGREGKSLTGRNQPKASQFVFGPARWIRGLIKPPPGRALAYVDYSSQEIGIAAALSGDAALLEAYISGDPYLAFAVQAGLAPTGASKASHPEARARCKACVLGVNYGMGERTLAQRLGESEAGARELLQRHRDVYRDFWRWAETSVDVAMLTNRTGTVFGWPVHAGPGANPRSLQNFPMQANGAEMLRLVCCLATEAGLAVAAPVHDALLLEAPAERLEADLAQLRACMAEASRLVLGGFEIRTDAAVVRHPARYMDEGGAAMWDRVMGLLRDVERATA